MFMLLLPVCWDGLGRIGGGTLVSVGCPGLVNKAGPRSADWKVGPGPGPGPEPAPGIRRVSQGFGGGGG